MKIRTLVLSILVVSTNTLSEGKWLDWGLSSMTNLDKVTSISGGILFKNRCNNGFSWTLKNWIKPHRDGQKYFGGFYSKERPTLSDITEYEVYTESYRLFMQENPTKIDSRVATRKQYIDWIDGKWIPTSLRDDINKVFSFEKDWLESTVESYYSEILLDHQNIWLSQGLCGDKEVTSEESASKLVQENLDQIRDFLDDNDSYRQLK